MSDKISEQLPMQILTRISIRFKNETPEMAGLLFSGRLFGKDLNDLTARIKLLEKFCDQAGLELWYNADD